MKKIILMFAAILILTSAAIESRAQTLGKSDEKPPETVDVWRKVMPDTEQNPNQPIVVMEESRNAVEVRETAEQIEKRILDLESKLTDAMQKRDAATLNYLIADDFMPAEINSAGQQPNKAVYVAAALKNTDLKNSVPGKTTVHVYQSTAIATVRYKQPSAAGAVADSEFIATNVWVRRAKVWQLVSHQESRLAK